MNSLRYQLPEGGEIYVARLRTTDDGLAHEYAEKIAEIGAVAWGESPWLKEIVRINQPRDPDNALASPDPIVIEGTARKLATDLFHGEERMEKRRSAIHDGGSTAVYGAFDGAAVSPERMIGFATTEPDVSGSDRAIAIKRAIDVVAPFIPFRASPVYTKVEGLNVVPDAQQQGIGTSLLATALLQSRYYRHATAYTFLQNDAARSMFEKNTFKPNTDPDNPQILALVTKTDYFGDQYPVEQLRFETVDDRVATIVEMQRSHPWLRSYTKVS